MYSSGSKPLPAKWERRMRWEVALEVVIAVAYAVLFLIFFLSFPVFASGTAVIDAVPTSAHAQPLVSDRQLDYLIFIGGSALVAGLNALLRRQKRAGKKSGPFTLFLLAIANSLVGNVDQTVRQGKAAVAKEPPQ